MAEIEFRAGCCLKQRLPDEDALGKVQASATPPELVSSGGSKPSGFSLYPFDSDVGLSVQ